MGVFWTTNSRSTPDHRDQAEEPRFTADYLTIAEAARRVRCCERTIRRAIDSGELRADRVRGGGSKRGGYRACSFTNLLGVFAKALFQAGRTAGIRGERSGLVEHVFRLLDGAEHPPTWLLLENVSFMLPWIAARRCGGLRRSWKRVAIRGRTGSSTRGPSVFRNAANG